MPLLENLFGVDKPIIGVVHLKPLPGSPDYEGAFREIVERALSDAKSLADGDVDGIIIENYGDKPYPKDTAEEHTIAAMSVVAWEIKKELRIPVGINILRNCSKAAMAIASIVDASFIRVNVFSYAMLTDQGIIEPNSAELLRYRRFLGSNVKIFADVLVKHAFSLVPIEMKRMARDTYLRAGADVLILTGEETGVAPKLEALKEVKKYISAPILAGSGVNVGNIEKILSIADGAIIGTYFKKNGITAERVDPERVRKIMSIVSDIRKRNR
ncbi:MAG TPA: BtpA/SgcQ family protein [Geobacterales bacterium]|nr:BtpA/SgcQ family protein [Geobacterales bacterium]